MMSGVRLLAISATITPETREDLTQRLFMYSANYFQASYHRPNLSYRVLECKGKEDFMPVICDFLR